jgi:hypothetical protein
MMEQTQNATHTPLIQVDNVHKSFLMGKEAVQALRGVTLEVVCVARSCA